MQSPIFWLKTKLTDFREFVWPLLEPEEKPSSENTQEPEPDIEIIIAEENLEKALELKLKINNAEEERRKGIESKASIFISTLSISTSIVVASNALISGNNDNTAPIKISVFISFILCIYTLRTVWFSVKTLERGNYHVLDLSDINITGDKSSYYKKLISTLALNTASNAPTINHKVDNFTMAQAYYKRSIFIICIFAFFILVYCFFFKASSETIKQTFQPHFAIIENNKLTKPLSGLYLRFKL